MWVKTIVISFISVLAFFALVFALGWIDIGEQTTYEVIRSIFVGQYFFFTAPVFIWSFFLVSGRSGKSLVMRMVVALATSLAVYTLIVKYLVSRLNG
jgi:bacteriorhodopsin